MSCPICYTLPADYGNSILCTCCGQLVCGNCVIDLYIHKNINCPICRTLYCQDNEIMISGLEKIYNKSVEAKVCLALTYYLVGRSFETRRLLELMGDKIYNFKGTCYYLAYLYRHGIGGKKESHKAFKLYLKVAEVGNSIFFLGQMFENGEGIPVNKSYGQILKKIIFNGNNYPVHCKTGKLIYT